MPLDQRRVDPVVNHGLQRQAFRPWIRQAESTIRYQTGIEGMALKGGRCAARVLQRKFVKVGGKQGPRVMPTRYLRSRSDPAKRNRQRRSMQRLANVANRLRPAMMLMP